MITEFSTPRRVPENKANTLFRTTSVVLPPSFHRVLQNRGLRLRFRTPSDPTGLTHGPHGRFPAVSGEGKPVEMPWSDPRGSVGGPVDKWRLLATPWTSPDRPRGDDNEVHPSSTANDVKEMSTSRCDSSILRTRPSGFERFPALEDDDGGTFNPLRLLLFFRVSGRNRVGPSRQNTVGETALSLRTRRSPREES